MKLIKFLLGSALLFTFGTNAFGQINFTFTGTVTSAPAATGYTNGSSFTITYTLNNYAPTAPEGSISDGMEWTEDQTGDPILWSNVSATGWIGSWTRPATQPYSRLVVYSGSDSILIVAGTTSASDSTGITVTGETVYGSQLDIVLDEDVIDDYPAQLPDSTEYFSALVGTYNISSTNFADVFFDVNGTAKMSLNYTSLTISAVPEPSTYAIISGLAILATVVFRRRRTA